MTRPPRDIFGSSSLQQYISDGTNSNMTAPNSFHLFPQLPMELRLKIYHLALTPRTVPVRLRLDLDAWNWSTEKDWWTTYAVVPDKEFPSSPMPSVLGACYEAQRELSGLYGCLEIERNTLESLLDPGSGKLHPSDGDDGESEEYEGDKSSSTKKLLESLLSGSQGRRRPRFNLDRDTLAWRDPRRWACCGDAQLRTLVHPLFLAASLSVRRVSVEYVPCMADLLEVLAFGVLNNGGGGGARLDALDVRVQNPSDCRVLRFRLCRVPETTRFLSSEEGKRGVVGRVMKNGDRPEDIEELVKRHGLVWFPWARGESYRNQEKIAGNASGHEDDSREPLVRSILDRILTRTSKPSPESAPAAPTDSPFSSFLPSANLSTRNVAILQVLADPTTGPGASGSWARIRHLREDPARVRVQYPHIEGETLSFGTGDLRLDMLLWCHMLKLHGAGYPANLPFDIVGVPCHGFCREEVGMGG